MADSADLRPAGEALQGEDVRNDKEAPSVDVIIPNDPDGLFDALLIKTQFSVWIPEWDVNNTPFDELVTLYWTREETPDDKIKLGSLEVPPGSTFPLEVVVQRRDYQQGKMQLSYEGINGIGNSFASQVLPVIVDTIPPYDGASPLDPTVVDNVDVITDAYLAANGDTLTLTIPEYPDRAPGDTAFFYWIKDVPKEVEDLPLPTLPEIDMDGPRTAVLTKAMLAQTGDGQCYGVYILRDKAGNISPISYWYAATVALGLLPENLLEPQVPAANDGVVNREDGFLGVQVHIPAFDNVKNGDLIYAKWGTTDLAVQPTGPNPDFPIRIAVPWQALVDNYQFGTEDPSQTVTISYHVERVGLRFPPAPVSREVEVWLDVVGPDKPDPDPVNPGLPPLTVKGDSGQDNTLIDTDNGKDATVTFLLYEGAKQGDRIQLVWKDVPGGEVYIVGDTQEPGDPVSITVPWNLIQGGGNGLQVPVCYRISDLDGVNYQQSPTTSVNVSAVIIVLPPPTFPDIGQTPTGNPIINCNSLRKRGEDIGLRVHVPPSEHLQAGTYITFDWFVAIDAEGTELIDGTGFNDRILISADQAREGVDWFIHPYATRLLPAFETDTRLGYSWLKYSVSINEIPITTEEVVEIIGLYTGPEDSCNLNLVPELP